ncbi:MULTISPECIES: hypothetical protein [unclassified Paracoccus (in: a-proteobacteria)]|uniref:hypothetical protein n=1 Tax=unclassified Paracoccus (in: a-proteobacteria) TaxID=2688777 RepID=UPI0012B31D2C|nr:MULTISPECIES: hypothetical protein [unclassified Paracoccus (in: a-proteobacteria)]UXU73807.1 hypothetical protein GB879_007610 [Paracoccus sp. SMMA_5]UXU79697.1 hypothetical protein GB880_007600 [Paracoccus sp. SMMA_5_TC]
MTRRPPLIPPPGLTGARNTGDMTVRRARAHALRKWVAEMLDYGYSRAEIAEALEVGVAWVNALARSGSDDLRGTQARKFAAATTPAEGCVTPAQRPAHRLSGGISLPPEPWTHDIEPIGTVKPSRRPVASRPRNGHGITDWRQVI